MTWDVAQPLLTVLCTDMLVAYIHYMSSLTMSMHFPVHTCIEADFHYLGGRTAVHCFLSTHAWAAFAVLAIFGVQPDAHVAQLYI